MKSDLVSWRFLRRAGRIALSRNADVEVSGLGHVPARGPVILAARHYHHLYDGCVLLSAIDRPAHIVVGLDWITNQLARRGMGRLCGLARWPIVLRPARGDRPDRPDRSGNEGARRAIIRRSARDVVALLREGRVVIVFPEGYPNVDPTFTPKQGEAFLTFEPGFLRYATIAERSGAGSVAIVPVGFAYERTHAGRWKIDVRFGAARFPKQGAKSGDLAVAIEADVIRLSAAPAG